MKFTEVEFKYKAEDIKLEDFNAFCQNRGKEYKLTVASGFDHFYSSNGNDESFCRHRSGPDTNQLTFKRKTKDANNFVRTEHNIDLLPFVKNDQVAALCSEFGYEYNFSLFKTCFVYKYDLYTFVYYVCYDTGLKELGRFVEIEMSEKHAWNNEEEVWNELLVMERICAKSLGISAQSRVKRSLYEMYKK